MGRTECGIFDTRANKFLSTTMPPIFQFLAALTTIFWGWESEKDEEAKLVIEKMFAAIIHIITIYSAATLGKLLGQWSAEGKFYLIST